MKERLVCSRHEEVGRRHMADSWATLYRLEVKEEIRSIYRHAKRVCKVSVERVHLARMTMFPP